MTEDTPTASMIARAGVRDEGTRKELAGIADTVAKSKKAIVITGAGISCNAGIPDFRSQDGLYNMVKARYPSAGMAGKDLFDSILFTDPLSTQVFYTFMAELRQCINGAKATATHKFIKKMSDRGRLVRCYTQNIDGLESLEGLEVCDVDHNKNQVLQLHGDIHQLKCNLCHKVEVYTEEYTQTLQSGRAPPCSSCFEKHQLREVAGLRTGRIGALRPNIVLYGEEHPTADAIRKMTAADLRRKPDLLLILGTSLKVTGIRSLVKNISKVVHAKGGKVVYINKTQLPVSIWAGTIDYWVEGCCDEWVDYMKEAKPSLWEPKQLQLPKMKVTKPKKISNKENEDPILPTSPSKRKTQCSDKVTKPKKAVKGKSHLPADVFSDTTMDLKPDTKTFPNSVV